jgi:hypothetical protein
MWWWIAVASAAELEGFQRVWIAGDALALTPVAPPAGAARAGLIIAVADPADIPPLLAAAEAAGLTAEVEDGRVLLLGPAAESLTVGGRSLSAVGEVQRIPALKSHLPGIRNALVIENPTTRRAEVDVNGVLIGRLLPRAKGAIVAIPPGSYAVGLTGPDGERREATIETIAENPRMIAPPAATLPLP